MEVIENNSAHYQYAKKRIEKVKGFYIHLAVYVVINTLLLILIFSGHSYKMDQFFRIDTFFTPIGWGIGLLLHGLGVFGPSLLYSKSWEKRKLKQYMQEEQTTQWE